MDRGFFYAEVIVDVDQMGEAGGGVIRKRMENSIAAGRAACDRSQRFYVVQVSFFLIKE